MQTQTSPTVTSEKSLFNRSCSVSIYIDANPDVVWGLMTDTKALTEWNSTIIKTEGNIAQGQQFTLASTLDPKRPFKLTVKEMNAPHKMVWASGNAPMFSGERTYTFVAKNGGTDFTMTEAFKGIMMPMIGGTLPDFEPNFEQFALDLKNAAEHQ